MPWVCAGQVLPVLCGSSLSWDLHQHLLLRKTYQQTVVLKTQWTSRSTSTRGKTLKFQNFQFPKYMTSPYYTLEDTVGSMSLCLLSSNSVVCQQTDSVSDLCSGTLFERELWESQICSLWKLFQANLFKVQERHTICLLDQRKSVWDLIKMILPSSQAV